MDIEEVRQAKRDLYNEIVKYIVPKCNQFKQKTDLEIEAITISANISYPIVETDNQNIVRDRHVSYMIDIQIEGI